jgi:uncharacterized protein YecE (DUF72 family)
VAGRVSIGTAGWTIPRAVAEAFPGEGGHLARYSRRFNATEINSSFHRPHRPATYAGWAECVPKEFRFSLKVPRAITHERRLSDATDLFAGFLAELAPLEDKLGPLLVQLPPSLAFDAALADAFFGSGRERFSGAIACEPRHASWFTAPADDLLLRHKVARVAADPVLAEAADEPGGWRGLTYVRLHGSPRPYFFGLRAGRPRRARRQDRALREERRSGVVHLRQYRARRCRAERAFSPRRDIRLEGYSAGVVTGSSRAASGPGRLRRNSDFRPVCRRSM